MPSGNFLPLCVGQNVLMSFTNDESSADCAVSTPILWSAYLSGAGMGKCKAQALGTVQCGDATFILFTLLPMFKDTLPNSKRICYIEIDLYFLK